MKTPTCVTRSKLPLRPHQKNVVKYLEKNDSVAVFHGTGWGKTLIAVAASQCFLDKNPDKKVVIITPSSLINNMKKELKNYGVEDLSSYIIISFDGFYRRYLQQKDICQGNMVIIDEVHNIRTMVKIIKNSQRQKTEPVRYAAVMNCMNMATKRLVLSATPYINDIKDLLPIVNFLHGKRIFGFKEDEMNIRGTFKAKKELIMKYLKNRVNYLPASALQGFPEVRERYVNIFMDADFEEKYHQALDDLGGLGEYNAPEKFYNGYRRAVNMAGGEESQKMQEAVKIIRTGKTILYTTWIEYGTEVLEEFIPRNIKYEVFSGEVTQKEKKRIVEDYNKDKIDLLIVTKSGAEGLDLKRTKNIVFDPPWNESSVKQIMGRGIRNNSHTDLPPSERYVNVYKFVLLEGEYRGRNGFGTEDSIDSQTGDYILYTIIHKKMEENKQVVDALMKISFK